MCIPKFTHIATVIPSLSIRRIKEIEREFELILNYNNPSVTDRVTRYMSEEDGGLGMIKINHFWRSIKMSWLRRLPFSKSTWADLHRAETKPHTYNPITTNWMDIETAKTKMINPVWKEIYDSLLVCRNNLLKNNTAIQRSWCENLTINDIWDENGDLKK